MEFTFVGFPDKAVYRTPTQAFRREILLGMAFTGHDHTIKGPKRCGVCGSID
jgi:hypothetical protein